MEKLMLRMDTHKIKRICYGDIELCVQNIDINVGSMLNTIRRIYVLN